MKFRIAILGLRQILSDVVSGGVGRACLPLLAVLIALGTLLAAPLGLLAFEPGAEIRPLSWVFLIGGGYFLIMALVATIAGLMAPDVLWQIFAAMIEPPEPAGNRPWAERRRRIRLRAGVALFAGGMITFLINAIAGTLMVAAEPFVGAQQVVTFGGIAPVIAAALAIRATGYASVIALMDLVAEAPVDRRVFLRVGRGVTQEMLLPAMVAGAVITAFTFLPRVALGLAAWQAPVGQPSMAWAAMTGAATGLHVWLLLVAVLAAGARCLADHATVFGQAYRDTPTVERFPGI